MGKQALNLSQMDKRADKGASLRRGCIDSVDGDIALVFVDGHDDAILGVAERDGEVCVVYDPAKIIQSLRRRDGMDKEGATEFFEYNIAGSCGPSGSPMFLVMVK